jgi:hypothetical protein
MYFVISEDFEDYKPVENIISLLKNFARSLGEKAEVITPTRGHYKETHRQVTELSWPKYVKREIDAQVGPFLLVLDRKLVKFEPLKDKFILLKFPDAFRDPEIYIPLLNEMKKRIKKKEDIFEWKSEGKKGTGLFAQLIDAIEMKPGAFGFSVDLKKLLNV